MERTDGADKHRRLADHLVHEAWYDMAEEEYRKAIEMNPMDAEAHYNLGVLLYNQGRYEEAEKEFREAIRIKPDYAGAHLSLGLLLADLQRFPEARAELENAIVLFERKGRKEEAENVRDLLRRLLG
ncbi:MAG: tetratricopeptide repeat protein [candidate division WOR-3 bacterium]